MKRHNFKKLALMGVTSGLLIVQQHAVNSLDGAEVKSEKQTAPQKGATSKPQSDIDRAIEERNESNMGYHEMSEDELILELDSDGEALYNSLNNQNKELARKVASARCNGTNLCAGLNACATDDHSCAGKGKCKGQGKCALSDKNLAVKLVADKAKAQAKK